MSVKKENLTEGIKYEKVDDYYEQDFIFNDEELYGYKDRNVLDVSSDKNIYDHVIYDSEIEREFAIDSSQLLQALLERIYEMDSDNTNLNDLILNGSCCVNDKPLLKGQDTALKHALEHPITFVWGPPGTGKTKTLSDMVIAFLKQGKRVLMVSQSNVSVDGAM